MAGAEELARAAKELDGDLETLHDEVSKLIRELSSGGELTQQFAEAVERGDSDRLERILGEAGLSDDAEVRRIEIHGSGSVDIDTCRRKQRVVCIKIHLDWSF